MEKPQRNLGSFWGGRGSQQRDKEEQMTVSILGLSEVNVCITQSTRTSWCITFPEFPYKLSLHITLAPGDEDWEVGRYKLVMAVNGNYSGLYLGHSLDPSNLHRVLCSLLTSITLKICPQEISTTE